MVAMVTTGKGGVSGWRLEEAGSDAVPASPLVPSAAALRGRHALVLVLPTLDREVVLHQNTV